MPKTVKVIVQGWAWDELSPDVFSRMQVSVSEDTAKSKTFAAIVRGGACQ